MMGNRTSEQWVAQYSTSHTHPLNRVCHTFGIPMIALSLPLFVPSLSVRGFWPLPVALYSAALFCLTEGRAYSAAEYRAWRGLTDGMSLTIVSKLLHTVVTKVRDKAASDHAQALEHARIVDELFELNVGEELAPSAFGRNAEDAPR